MRVPRLFLDPAAFVGETVTITAEAHHHLARVLRASAGEQVVLLDGRDGAWLAELAAVGKSSSEARIISAAAMPPEPALHVTVAQALGKGDKFEQVIQHGTEVGASAFIPLLTEHTVVKPPLAKLPRWQQIAQSAAEQCGRALVPTIHHPGALAAVLASLNTYDEAILLHPPGDSVADMCRERPPSRSPVGPEQGTGQRPFPTPRPADGAPPADRRAESPSPPAAAAATSGGDRESALRSAAQPGNSDAGAPYRILLLVGPEGGFSDAEVAAAHTAGARLASLGPYTLRTETAALVALARLIIA